MERGVGFQAKKRTKNIYLISFLKLPITIFYGWLWKVGRFLDVERLYGMHEARDVKDGAAVEELWELRSIQRGRHQDNLSE